ncbi:hypothetical protein [Streptomyces sp. NPDC048411]|uniref:hypothetical protein n=1 Tax=Streptomyces sp. NPDC048411 TaxID=3157206 RepID=UPI003451121A
MSAAVRVIRRQRHDAGERPFIVDHFPEAGHYSVVDHDTRHAEAGAMGMVEVSD